MQLTLVLMPVALASCMIAQPLGPKLGYLIPSDARFVYGMDVVRYQRSLISAFYPISIEGSLDTSSEVWRRNINELVVVGSTSEDRGKITILSVNTASLLSSASQRRGNLFPLPDFRVLGDSTVIFGDQKAIHNAARLKGGDRKAKVNSEPKHYVCVKRMTTGSLSCAPLRWQGISVES